MGFCAAVSGCRSWVGGAVDEQSQRSPAGRERVVLAVDVRKLGGEDSSGGKGGTEVVRRPEVVLG